MEQQKAIEVRFPTITFSFVFISLIAYCWPHLSDLLVYDRQAIIKGEVWRLWTSPFVHFSVSHICWDLLVYCAAGWTIEASGYRCYWLVCCLAVLIPGPILLMSWPEIARYGGLSGLATGAVAYLCLCELKRSGRNKIIWLAILALIGIKTVVETVTCAPIFASAADMPFLVLPSVHAFGCAAALAALMWTWLKKAIK